MTTKKYLIKGMDCTSCAMLIESDLEDIGVLAKCSFVNQSLDVQFDPKIISEAKIKKTVKLSGYSVS